MDLVRLPDLYLTLAVLEGVRGELVSGNARVWAHVPWPNGASGEAALRCVVKEPLLLLSCNFNPLLLEAAMRGVVQQEVGFVIVVITLVLSTKVKVHIHKRQRFGLSFH